MLNTGSETVQLSWFDRLKNSINFESIAQKLNLSKYRFLDLALFFGIGFLIGFLWKRYANYFIAMVIFATVLFIMHQLELIQLQINWFKWQECCGVQSPRADADILGMLWDWTKMNVLILVSFLLGFSFGAKVS